MFPRQMSRLLLLVTSVSVLAQDNKQPSLARVCFPGLVGCGERATGPQGPPARHARRHDSTTFDDPRSGGRYRSASVSEAGGSGRLTVGRRF